MTESYTAKELADELGMTWQTIASLKRRNLLPDDALDADGKYVKSVMVPLIEDLINDGTISMPVKEKSKPASKKPASKKPAAKKAPKPETQTVDFDEFVRQYWKKEDRAVDVLLMPQEEISVITKHVNEALKYAYEKLEK